MTDTDQIHIPDANPNMGAPSSYTPEIATEICRRIANDESLVSICNDEHLPDRDTIHNWIFNWDKRPEYQEFLGNYIRARQQQPEATYERLFQIEELILDGSLTPNAGRVLLDSMHWRMGKRAPKIYGDHKQLEISGGIDLNVSPIHKALPVGANRPALTEDKRKRIAPK